MVKAFAVDCRSRIVRFKVRLEPEGKSTLAIISKSRSTSDKPAIVGRLPTGLEKELIKRGVDRAGKNSASKLVARHSESHIQEQMENFDDRIAHGEQLSPGWLVAAIESEQGYSFRKGFKSSAQKKAEAEKRRKLQAEKAATQERERQELAEQQRQAQVALVAFEEFRDTFSEHEQITMEDEALKRCDKFMRDLVLKARRRGEVSLYHQMLWEQYIIPTVDHSRRELEKCSFEI